MKYITQILCFCTLMGCLTPIDFALENQTGSITIYGQVSNFARRNYVDVGLTAGTSRKPIGVGSATVVLKDSNGNSFQYEKSNIPGRYVLPAFQGVPGTTFWIEVMLSSGEIITSEPDQMPLDVGEDEISWNFSEELLTDADGFVNEIRWFNIEAKPTLPPGKQLYLKWSVDEIYMILPTDFPDPFGSVPPPCYVTEVTDDQRITLLNSADQGQVTDPLLIARRRFDNTFHTRIFFLTYQSSLSPAAFKYWEKAHILATQVGSIFDTPPARLVGNLHVVGDETRTIHGYFNALNEEYNKFSITRAEVPYPFLRYCEYTIENLDNSPNYYTRECLNCLVVQGSSYVQPPEWSN